VNGLIKPSAAAAVYGAARRNRRFSMTASIDGFDVDGLTELSVVLLADTEGTVDCLVFDSRVPPPVEIEDIVAHGQVQTCAAGFDGENAERLTLAVGRLQSARPSGRAGVFGQEAANAS
jgi:hypothetical protein